MNLKKTTLSVVINTKNADQLAPHHRFEATLNSVKFADEIIVVDMQSSDDTVKIASKHTDKIYNFGDVGYVEPARNFAIGKASCDWILIVDADEEIPRSLAEKIENLIKGDATADAYKLPRKNIVFGAWYQFAGWWPDYQLRLFKKGSVKWSDKIHSVPQVKGVVDELAPADDLAIIHHNYQSLDQFLDRLNRYTSIEAKNRENRNISPTQVVSAFEAELLSRLFKHNGISGGMHGISLSFLQSFYEIVVVLKQWELDGFKEKKQTKGTVRALNQLSKNLNYWLDDYEITKTNGFRKLLLKLRRRFKL